MPNAQRPEYFEKAVDIYRSCSSRCAQVTVALALASVEFASEIAAGRYGKAAGQSVAKETVAKILAAVLHDNTLASRLFHLANLVRRAENQQLKLDGVRSQGVLFAMVTAWRREPSRLAEMIADGAVMSISDFRAKWTRRPTPVRRKTVRTSAPLDRDQIITWLETAPAEDVEAILVAVENQISRILRGSQKKNGGDM